MIVPGGGISLDGQRWVSGRPPVLPTFAGVRYAAPRPDGSHRCAASTGQLKFFGRHARLAERKAFAADAARMRAEGKATKS
jgi:hypothetical protein